MFVHENTAYCSSCGLRLIQKKGLYYDAYQMDAGVQPEWIEGRFKQKSKFLGMLKAAVNLSQVCPNCDRCSIGLHGYETVSLDGWIQDDRLKLCHKRKYIITYKRTEFEFIAQNCDEALRKLQEQEAAGVPQVVKKQCDRATNGQYWTTYSLLDGSSILVRVEGGKLE